MDFLKGAVSTVFVLSVVSDLVSAQAPPTEADDACTCRSAFAQNDVWWFQKHSRGIVAAGFPEAGTWTFCSDASKRLFPGRDISTAMEPVTWTLQGGTRTTDCAGLTVTTAVMCGLSRQDEAMDWFLLASVSLRSALHCLDVSSWPFWVAEILDNILRFMENSFHVRTPFSWRRPRTPGLLVTSMQKREVLEARRDVVVPDPHNGGLSLKIHANFSKNTIEAETLERRINWVFGHWDHARFWESKLSPDRITAETLHTWRAGELDSWMTEPCEHVMLTPARGHARILNAGSGPLIRSAPLRCGDTFAHITNCDHSSRYYRLLAARYGYEDVPLPEHCNFEDLRLFYPLQYFDLVHVRNALDHCVSPELAVVGLVDILRSGGVAVLHHFENVHPGKWTSLESGLHQWGVTLRGDSSGTTSDSRDSPHLIIENLHVSHDITEMLRSSAEVTARREGHFIIAIIKRL